MPELQLQPSLSADVRSQACLQLAARLGRPGILEGGAPAPGRIDVGALLVYWIDAAPASALPYLLWQFDLLSPLWQLLAPIGTPDTPALRSLIKAGIRLHAIRGTVAALKRVLQAVGWGAPAPAEPTVRVYEGQDAWGGTLWPSDEGWAVYRVSLPATALLTIDPLADLSWQPTIAYAPGDVATYPGHASDYFIAVTPPPVGCPPYYFLEGDIGDVRWISDFGALTTIFWVRALERDGVIYRILTPSDIARIIAACQFVAPIRSWLDQIDLMLPPVTDALPPFSDQAIAPAGIAAPIVDALPPWSDAIAVTLPALHDALGFVPNHGGAWTRAGITYRAQPVRMADGAIIVNGRTREGNT